MSAGRSNAVAVLASGGLDSAALLADLARERVAWPLYVRAGLAWEEAERVALGRYIKALDSPNVRGVVELEAPMRPVYGEHWSLTGRGVPKPGDADAAVYMPGRNIILIGLAATWCAVNGVRDIAIGSLGGNPFPDATPRFFRALASALSEGLAHEIRILAPYRSRSKRDLIRQYAHLPLEYTLTCMTPVDGLHCGLCQKCEERLAAFAASGEGDRTRYAGWGEAGE